MNTYQFLMLSQEEQNNVIANQSHLIMRTENNGSYTKLYAVALFFIEVEQEYISNKVLNISIFVTGKKLDKYSGNVNLEY